MESFSFGLFQEKQLYLVANKKVPILQGSDTI